LGSGRRSSSSKNDAKEFSNVRGLTHIPFPKEKIEAQFHEAMRVLPPRPRLDPLLSALAKPNPAAAAALRRPPTAKNNLQKAAHAPPEAATPRQSGEQSQARRKSAATQSAAHSGGRT
jgi:hypothetical protein